MSDEYTSSRSRPGARLNTGTDDRELFLLEFGDMVMQAWAETNTYESLTFTKSITQGKADTFPIIGRKRDAEEHEPGERILGGRIESNDVEISLDRIMVDSVFIADIDQLMSHYEFQGPYARQLGESLSTTYDRRIATMHINAARTVVRPYGVGKTFAEGGGPLPNGYFDSSVATDPAKLEEAAFAAVEWIKLFDIGGGPLQYILGHGQLLLLAKYSSLDQRQWTGSANRAAGTIGSLAGLYPKGTNHLPKTNITTGNLKYQGDFSAVVGHISNPMAVGTLARKDLSVRMVDQPDRLGTLLIASKLTGHGVLRAECAFEVATSDATSPAARGSNHPDAALAVIA